MYPLARNMKISSTFQEAPSLFACFFLAQDEMNKRVECEPFLLSHHPSKALGSFQIDTKPHVSGVGSMSWVQSLVSPVEVPEFFQLVGKILLCLRRWRAIHSGQYSARWTNIWTQCRALFERSLNAFLVNPHTEQGEDGLHYILLKLCSFTFPEGNKIDRVHMDKGIHKGTV